MESQIDNPEVVLQIDTSSKTNEDVEMKNVYEE
jgi:hypothetical protein